MKSGSNKNIPITYEKTEETPVRVSLRGKQLAAVALATVAAAGIGYEIIDANTSHFHGEHSVTITEKTVTGIAQDNVKGAGGHIQDTVQKIVDMNPGVFHGQAFVGSEAYGETIEVPNSVD